MEVEQNDRWRAFGRLLRRGSTWAAFFALLVAAEIQAVLFLRFLASAGPQDGAAASLVALGPALLVRMLFLWLLFWLSRRSSGVSARGEAPLGRWILVAILYIMSLQALRGFVLPLALTAASRPEIALVGNLIFLTLLATLLFPFLLYLSILATGGRDTSAGRVLEFLTSQRPGLWMAAAGIALLPQLLIALLNFSSDGPMTNGRYINLTAIQAVGEMVMLILAIVGAGEFRTSRKAPTRAFE